MKSAIIIQKPKQYCLLVFFSILFISSAHSQTLRLPDIWKFKLGDNMDWATSSFNDADWGTKQIGQSWATKEVKDNVYAWYRTKIVIPSSMKATVEKGKDLKLHLGKIDDVDQTFFNGKLIGQTGSLPPKYVTKWNVERSYDIPLNAIQWDNENEIAVRVFSLDNGGIGMYQGPYSLTPVKWTDFISVDDTICETKNNGFVTKIKLTNKNNGAFEGAVHYWITDKTGKKVFTESKSVNVKPGKGAESIVSLSDFQPVKDQIFNVGYWITDINNTDTIKREQVYLANKVVHIEVGNEPKPIIENKVPDTFVSIPIPDQKLQGYLGERLKQNLEERLLKIHENGIMAGYLKRPGNQDWIGEHVGKYLEAACNVWENTRDVKLKEQMDRMVYELINTQKKNGYLGTYTPNNYWTSWDVWSHTYNLYGLLAYYKTTGYRPALEACMKIGDLLCTTFGNKPGQRDINLAGEHVGMAATCALDPMVTLYRYTGDKKYLDFCYYIVSAMEQHDGPKIISSLLSTGDVYKVADAKAYEMLANLVGFVNFYRLTGEKKFLNPVLIAWQDIAAHKLYVTGTTSSFECFKEDGVLPASENDHIGEGCVTVTWLELNQKLLAVTGELKYLDQAEKSIYNHLLGAENPETGGVSYYTPLMGIKEYSSGISCCISNVPRGISRIPFFTFGNLNDTPTLMLYGPASYKDNITTPAGVKTTLSVQIESDFPKSGNSLITINTTQNAFFPFALRVPSWCSSFIAEVKGKQYAGIANQYLLIKRDWKSGDKIRISFKMPVKVLDGGKSYPGQTAFQRGPQVLAFDSSLNPDLPKEFSLGAKEKLLAEEPEALNSTGVLPEAWIGKQAYVLHIPDTQNKLTKEKLILVPYADAGQTGGDVKVWLSLNENK